VGDRVPPEVQERVAKALVSGAVSEIEMRAADRVFSMVFAPVREGGYVNVYGRDITVRKRAEEALRQAVYRGERDHHRRIVQERKRLTTSEAVIAISGGVPKHPAINETEALKELRRERRSPRPDGHACSRCSGVNFGLAIFYPHRKRK
jgi:hypothetical protein